MSEEMKKAKAESEEIKDAGVREEAEGRNPDEGAERSEEETEEADGAAGSEDGGPAEEADEDEKTGEDRETGEEDASGEDEVLLAKYTRLMADFQNYKRRTEKEKSDIYAYANEKLITGLLEVIDNFERAVLSETADEKYAEGMEMIFKQLKRVLEGSGLEEIKALGEGFDPNFHNAVMTEENDNFESGSVTEVLQKGYTLNGKVIRPSMVKVNK